jgi:pseudouridine kinase
LIIDYITPSEDELESILGAEMDDDVDIDIVGTAEELKGRGAKNVIVSLGERGIYVSSGGGVSDFSEGEQGDPEPGKFMGSYKGEVVDVTGAGDALVAGLVYGICKGYSLEVAARFGLAGAALTVSTREVVRRDLREGLLRSRIEEGKEEEIKRKGRRVIVN